MESIVKVRIKGNPPGLLMHSTRGMLETLKTKTRLKGKEYSPEVEAELSAYWTTAKGKKKELCIPARIFFAAMMRGAGLFRVKGRSVVGTLAGSIKIEPYEVSLGTSKYEIDIQFVNVNRAKIPRARAHLSNWEAEFNIVFDPKFVAEDTIKDVLTEVGKKIGIMDFRPATKGPYGTFEIVKWKRIKE